MLAMHRLLLYALAAMNGGPFSSDPVVQEDYISPLPGALRRSLMAVHASGRSKHSAVPWRPEMDAFVLLRHVRDGISLPKVAEQWPFESATKRSKDAIKWRWKKVLKRLDALDDLRLICGSCDEREEAETQMNTEASLQPWVEDALVKLHARKNVSMNSNYTPWTIEEDRLLLHSYQSGAKITDIRVSSRSAEAIKLQLRRLQNVTPLVRDAHYKSRCDPEAPFQYLQHDIWTPIDSTLALPPCAQIDWIRGVAKVPPLPCSPARARDHSAISND